MNLEENSKNSIFKNCTGNLIKKVPKFLSDCEWDHVLDVIIIGNHPEWRGIPRKFPDAEGTARSRGEFSRNSPTRGAIS